MLEPMSKYPRYAIYYAAEPGSIIDRFGSELLGYDAHRGIDLPFPPAIELPHWRELTQDPRKYGFHATLKPPMALSRGKSEDELIAACAAFARAPRAIATIKPVVDIISGFIAVVPAVASAELEHFAADCVREFEPFRAPLTEEDRARRNPSKLTPRQRDYLDRWGYPYVFEEFRFHMTLTGRLDAGLRAHILEILRSRFRDCGVNDLAIDRIALFRQDDHDQRFHIVSQWPLQSASL
jgi:putative phosphonate metabolism protein